MRVNCTIDGIKYSINASSDKPLQRILLEVSPSFSSNNNCKGAECGNCVVLLDNQCVLSCLIPACRLEGAEITTFEAFRKTRACHDIEKAYTDSGAIPCPQCYASKTLLIESLVSKLEKNQNSGMLNSRKRNTRTGVIDYDYIKREMEINNCTCIEMTKVESIVKLAYQNRRRRSG